jgi:hypothetical protein
LIFMVVLLCSMDRNLTFATCATLIEPTSFVPQTKLLDNLGKLRRVLSLVWISAVGVDDDDDGAD